MENILFSLNIVMPIFFIIILGIFLKWKGILTEEFCSKATTLIFYVALPCSLFRSVAAADITNIMDLKFIVYAILSSLVVFFGVWFVAVRLLKTPSEIGATVHGSYRGNFAYIGLAVLESLCDVPVLSYGVLVIAFVVPIYNILGVWVLSYYDPSGRKVSTKEILLGIIKNPLIIGIIIAIPFSIGVAPMPFMVDKTIAYLAQIATPVALLCIGANMSLDTFKSKPKGIIIASVTKIVAAPLLGTTGAALIGMRGEALATIFVMLGVPAAANSYIMTKKMNGDAELGAGIVVVTSLLSTITLAIGIIILKSFNLL